MSLGCDVTAADEDWAAGGGDDLSITSEPVAPASCRDEGCRCDCPRLFMVPTATPIDTARMIAMAASMDSTSRIVALGQAAVTGLIMHASSALPSFDKPTSTCISLHCMLDKVGMPAWT